MANWHFTIVLHGRGGLIRGHRTWGAGAARLGWRVQTRLRSTFGG